MQSFRRIIETNMTLADKIETLDDKMKVNQAQDNLDREAAKIPTLSSCKLEKDEYLASKDLGYKSGVSEEAQFEYSPLG